MTHPVPPRRPPLGPRVAAAAALACALLASCELGRKQSVQVGYRGVGQEIVADVPSATALAAARRAPPALPAAGPAPAVQWQNVQVLNDVSATEMTRTMTAMSQWVTGNAGNCAYCHVLSNMASDSLYPKRVARQMLRMTREVNTNWRAHVGKTGVTCYTCHMGQPVPNGVWYLTDREQYLRHYLDRDDIRVQSSAVAPTPVNRTSIKQTENTYALMISMSRALGVNCTYCHNSRSWATWQNAPPARVTALYGVRMLRSLNANYLAPLQPEFPAFRLGEHGDAPKAQCVTCHQGAYKPLYGAAMVRDYPGLWGHPGPWEAPTPADTGRNGIVDLRDGDSVPRDERAPRLPPAIPPSRPAPARAPTP